MAIVPGRRSLGKTKDSFNPRSLLALLLVTFLLTGAIGGSVDLEGIANELSINGWVYVPDFLAAPEALALLTDAQAIRASGEFESGTVAGQGVSGGLSFAHSQIRGDTVYWSNGAETDGRWRTGRKPHEEGTLSVYLGRVDTLMKDLSGNNLHRDALGGIEERSLAMLAHYPGNGAEYVQHVDNRCSNGQGAACNGRRLTAILYLNAQWEARDGGELILFRPPPDQNVAWARVPPKLGSLVLFWSDDRVPHAVLPTFRDRYAVSTWYFDKTERAAALARAPSAEGAEADAKTQREMAAFENSTGRKAEVVVLSDDVGVQGGLVRSEADTAAEEGGVSLQDAVIRVILGNGTVGEFGLGPCKLADGCWPQVANWCADVSIGDPSFQQAVSECVRVLSGLVQERLSPDTDILYPSWHKAQMRDFLYSTKVEREGLPPALPSTSDNEASAFVRSAPLGVADALCNRLPDLPLFGPHLARPSGADGALLFKGSNANGGDSPAPDGGLVVLLRLHERASPDAEKRDSVKSLRDPSLACLGGLRSALVALPAHVAAATSVHVFLNNFHSVAALSRYQGFVASYLSNNASIPSADSYSVAVHTDSPGGNAASFAHMLAALRRMALAPSAVVFFLEDDVLLLPSALVEMVELFASHRPCFVSPIDFAEYYVLGDLPGGLTTEPNDSDPATAAAAAAAAAAASAEYRAVFAAPAVVVAGRRRHWRTAPSTAATYAARQGTLDFYAAHLPLPSDDLLRSNYLARVLKASVLTPLPSLAVVSETLSDFTEPSYPLFVAHADARAAFDRGRAAWCAFAASEC